ncbi:hypothetical protein Aegir_gp5 [Pelagibacter phage Aegir EXVC013S]|nr:hypothetical protein Aegir_gp5 [Pelagibacter phage Aegir EXVC013S]QLF88495.1 hypothetical protein Kolga_gp48 [Pelagibacter phage Kolga EXVC016S]
MPRGGYRPNAGRPKQTSEEKLLNKQLSTVDKLKKLKLDPIDILNKELKALKDKTDTKSQNLRVRIAEKLLEYGYSKQPTSLHTSGTSNMPVLTIVKKSQDNNEKVVSPILDEIPAENTNENETSETS